MKSFKEKIEVNNNQDKCKDRATHKHSNGDLYVKADEPHEFGEWLNFKHSNGFWTKSLLIAKNESVLTPIKKLTPTKFVKVEESIFDLKGEFERGELYSSDCDGHYTQLKCEKKLYLAAHQDSVYRQVEIDWRVEVNSYFLKTKVLGIDCTIEESIETDFYNDEFVAACHLVASLTEKPEGI